MPESSTATESHDALAGIYLRREILNGVAEIMRAVRVD